jgi:hypothetical protein
MLYDTRWEKKPKRGALWRTVLLDAADIIEAWGWIQGAFQTGEGICMHEAIDVVTDQKLYRNRRAKQELKKALGGLEIYQWNDMPGRTKKQVLAALRTVAVM